MLMAQNLAHMVTLDFLLARSKLKRQSSMNLHDLQLFKMASLWHAQGHSTQRPKETLFADILMRLLDSRRSVPGLHYCLHTMDPEQHRILLEARAFMFGVFWLLR